jgi:hypothetical protein
LPSGRGKLFSGSCACLFFDPLPMKPPDQYQDKLL